MCLPRLLALALVAALSLPAVASQSDSQTTDSGNQQAEQQQEKKPKRNDPWPDQFCIGSWCKPISRDKDKKKKQEVGAQEEPQLPPPNPPPPRSSEQPGFSSSKDTKIDLRPPREDEAEHPESSLPEEVRELRPYDPHRAAKNIEVGDFYYSRGNYRAALSRYQEALDYKPGDALATFRLAQALEKVGRLKDAYEQYQAYLTIRSQGEEANQARQALQQLEPKLAAAGHDPAALRAQQSLERGEEYLVQGNYPVAIIHLREAVRLAPKEPRALFRLAQALERLGDFTEAQRYYEAYLRLDPVGEFAQEARQAVSRLRPQTERSHIPTSSSE